jgi:hypothetical protein
VNVDVVVGTSVGSGDGTGCWISTGCRSWDGMDGVLGNGWVGGGGGGRERGGKGWNSSCGVLIS